MNKAKNLDDVRPLQIKGGTKAATIANLLDEKIDSPEVPKIRNKYIKIRRNFYKCYGDSNFSCNYPWCPNCRGKIKQEILARHLDHAVELNKEASIVRYDIVFAISGSLKSATALVSDKKKQFQKMLRKQRESDREYAPSAGLYFTHQLHGLEKGQHIFKIKYFLLVRRGRDTLKELLQSKLDISLSETATGIVKQVGHLRQSSNPDPKAVRKLLLSVFNAPTVTDKRQLTILAKKGRKTWRYNALGSFREKEEPSKLKKKIVKKRLLV